jgi:hypothetical protein
MTTLVPATYFGAHHLCAHLVRLPVGCPLFLIVLLPGPNLALPIGCGFTALLIIPLVAQLQWLMQMGVPLDVIQNLWLSRQDDTQWRASMYAIDEWRKVGREFAMQNNNIEMMIVDDDSQIYAHTLRMINLLIQNHFEYVRAHFAFLVA